MKCKRIFYLVSTLLMVMLSVNLNSYAVTMPSLRITSNSYSVDDKVTLNEVNNVEVEKTLQLYAIIGYSNAGVVPSPLDPDFNDFDFDSIGYYVIQTNLSGVTWTSSDTSIATVDSTGKVTGISEGKVTITAKYDGDVTLAEKSASFEINVLAKPTLVSMYGFKFFENCEVGGLNKYIINNEKDFAIAAGQVEYKDEKILYSIDNEKVAKIVKNENNIATVKFVGTGNATISAILSYNGKEYSDKYSFTVVNNEDEFYDYRIESDSNTIKMGKTTQLKLTEFFGTTTPKDVTSEATWTSDNENVAKVNETGLVTGVNAGSATIMATYKKGSRTVSIKYSMKVEENFTGISFLDKSLTPSAPFVLNKEHGFWIYLYNIPDTEKENIKVTINNENVAKITRIDLCNWKDGSGKGMIIANAKFLSLGEFTITASLNYNGKTYTDSYTSAVTKSRYVLTISTKEGKDLPEKLEIGKTIQLNAILGYYGSTLTENITTNGAVWTSSNEEIATVKDGLITAKKEGKVTITAKFSQKDDSITETYDINITDPTKTPVIKVNDSTIAKTKIPQTGENYIIMIIVIVLVVLLTIVMYRKYKEYKKLI